jgi:hypothetical protein
MQVKIGNIFPTTVLSKIQPIPNGFFLSKISVTTFKLQKKMIDFIHKYHKINT